MRPPGPPPHGPDYPAFPYPPPGGGPRRSRWKLVTAILGGVALLVAAATGGWLFFSGRLGFGPLSAQDEAAAAEIAGAVNAPGWTDDAAVACAADTLLHDVRSKELAEHGTVRKDGDGWSYTGEWEPDDAAVLGQGLLTCSDDWASQVADEWNLDDAGCLGDIGVETMGRYFAGDVLAADDEDFADDARADAVAALDDCYVTEPKKPRGKAKADYRSVRLSLDVPETDNATNRIKVRSDGDVERAPGDSYRVFTKEKEGGKRACATVLNIAEYAWGTTRKAQQRMCGTAKPKRLWWERARRCNPEHPAGYECFELHYEGFKSYAQIIATYTDNGGHCNSDSGSCTTKVGTDDTGRGIINTWRFPVGYNGHFVATVGELEAVLPIGTGGGPSEGGTENVRL